jgi:hypothetical protein
MRPSMHTLARERDTAEILRRLRNVSPDSVRRWGRMSAHQMVCHLIDSWHMAIGEKRVSDASGILQRTFVKCVALYVPLRWPVGLVTRPEINQELAGTRPANFAADLEALVALVERLTAPRHPVRWASAHPVFGRMSTRAWLRWAYLHMDHHLRQFGA